MGTPDWQVVIEDDQPEIYVNAAAIARMACDSPLGIHAAMHALKNSLPADAFKAVEDELWLIANGGTR